MKNDVIGSSEGRASHRNQWTSVRPVAPLVLGELRTLRAWGGVGRKGKVGVF